MTDIRIHSLKDLPTEHLLGAGTAMCAGCGGLETVHQVHDLTGGRTVFVNAAGCMTLLANWPFTPFRGGFLYTSMASAAAGAQGVRDALDILIAKGRIPPEEDMTAVVLAGDGSSYGMGLSATSSAIERGLDFLYVCYDNEGYGNTGQQSSEATPFAARTATEAAGMGHAGWKKDLFGIWAAHGPVWAATAIAAEPLDLARKVERAMRLKGPRLILALAPCPTGWGYDPKDTVEIGRLAVRTGIFPLKEYVDGRVTHTKIPRPRLPVEDYLATQQRFRHLFAPQRQDAAIARIQQAVDAYWAPIEATPAGASTAPNGPNASAAASVAASDAPGGDEASRPST